MIKRIITAVILGAGLIVLLLLGGYYVAGVAVVASLIAQYEMIRTMSTDNTKLMAAMLYIFAILILPVYMLADIAGVFILFIFVTAAIFTTAVLDLRYTIEGVVRSIFTMYYPQLFFAALYMTAFSKNANMILWILFAAPIATDVFAYFIGVFFGKNKLCPNISPKKTVEGAVAGLVGGTLAVSVVAYIYGSPGVDLIYYALLGLIMSVAAQVGDLSASLIKRRFGVKDYGNIFPGHGGLMDRMDSILFVVPIAYAFYLIFLR